MVTQLKLRSLYSRIARGLLMAKKSTDCGLNLTNVALGRLQFRIRMRVPSETARFDIIQ